MAIVGSALVIIVSAVIGLSVFPRLGSEGFNDPASDSEQVARILEREFDSPESSMVIAVMGDESVDSAASIDAGTDLADAAASNNPQLTTLVAAVKAAGLVDTLNGPGPFTIFAPTNEAFALLPNGTIAHLLDPRNI